MLVGSKYQVHITDSPGGVSQVRVVKIEGDWVQFRYDENSTRVDPNLDEVWVNSNHIIWLVPYE